ncbi:MAG: metallophosphoesterase [Planctomycetota bacterium]
MKLFAIADTHLGQAVDKPMDVFGPAWERHTERLQEQWRATVGEDDTVLVAGDISWGMSLEEALVDLRLIADLPGRKILLKGNHDYWWTSKSKVEKVLPESMTLLQNNAVDLGSGLGVVGTRGWSAPGAPHSTEHDEKIYRREVDRLRLSIEAAGDRFETLVAMLHFPPAYEGFGDTEFVPLLEAAGVRACVFGHLHGSDHRFALQGERRGVHYHFVAADATGFQPREIALS